MAVLRAHHLYKRLFSVVMAVLLTLQMSIFSVPEILFYRGPAEASAATAGKVNTGRLNVRSGPGTGYSIAAVLSANMPLSIESEVRGDDGYTWYAVTTSSGVSGYVRHDYVSLQKTYGVQDGNFEAWLNEQGFPESYKNGLRGLHEKYPAWIFRAQHTGLDWNTVINEESSIGRNLVASTDISSWKSTEEGAFDWAGNYWPGFDDIYWQQASREIISYYMDPRNFLGDPYVFQFQLQSYNPAVQNREGLQRMVAGTFLEGSPNDQRGSSSEPGRSGSSSGGTISYGPGSSSYSDYGPGVSASSSGSVSSSGPGGGYSDADIGSGPGAVFNPVNMIFRNLGGLFTSSLELLLPIESQATGWEKQSRDPVVWVFRQDDGSLLKGGWFWIDGNHDGTAESYYLDENGVMAANTDVGGYYVNADGQWTVDGAVQKRAVSYTGASFGPSDSGTGSGTSSGYTGGGTYVDLLMRAAEESGVSPYVLAAMIIQEQGKKGTGGSISGSYGSYAGYYNYYNTAAYAHDGMNAIEAGLQYAAGSGSGDRPWDSHEKAIIGGAKNYGTNYVNAGQNTFYLKKYNVQGSNKYNHQYMTYVSAAALEGSRLADAYSDEIKSTALEFKIPVYKNMPDLPCEMPVKDGNPNNKLASLTVYGYTITPSFHMNTTDYTLIVGGDVHSIDIEAVTIDGHARVSGTGQVNLSFGTNQITLTVTAQNGDTRNYHLNVTRRNDGSYGTGNVAGGSPGAPAPAVITSPAAMQPAEQNAASAAAGPVSADNPQAGPYTQQDSSLGGGIAEIGFAPGM